MELNRSVIMNNATLMTFLRGCIGSYVVAAYYGLEFPITKTEIIEQNGQEMMEIFFQDKRSVESVVQNLKMEEFNSMNELVEETLSYLTYIILDPDYDMESVEYSEEA